MRRYTGEGLIGNRMLRGALTATIRAPWIAFSAADPPNTAHKG
ncbi:MAG: hypothetical protein ACLFR8_08700 [Alkalispirochaeta sp.]